MPFQGLPGITSKLAHTEPFLSLCHVRAPLAQYHEEMPAENKAHSSFARQSPSARDFF